MTISDSIRQAIESSGESRYAIAKATGVSQATLSRFIHGQIEMKLNTADAICQHLRLELRPIKRARKAAPSTRKGA